LQAVDGLGDCRVDGVVVVYVLLFQVFHLERVQVDVQGQQVEGEVSHLDEVQQFGGL